MIDGGDGGGDGYGGDGDDHGDRGDGDDYGDGEPRERSNPSANTLDPVELSVRRNRLESVAEEMGEVLVGAAVSPNITERRDCSTALFDAEGRLLAQAEHVPVHLGALPRAVRAVLDADPAPGEAYVLNDPFAGGSHLPDVTLVTPVAVGDGKADGEDGEGGEDGTDAASGDGGDATIVGYAASRAHHADVGGATPGSLPADATDVYAEGLRIPPTPLVSDGTIREDVLELILANVRAPDRRRVDLRAQVAATERGADRFRAFASDADVDLAATVDAVLDYSRRRMREEIRSLPDGSYEARDALEGDGVTDDPVPIVATVTVDGTTLTVDFAGSADQVAGSVNAPIAVAESAVYFAVRSVTDPDVPPNQGAYDPIAVDAPEGSVLNPRPPAAVAAGNVETSQRVADVVLSALAEAAPGRVPAAGQGTMNNLLVGDRAFSYYETIGGGGGATPTMDGADCVHVGMTNTQNTPIEALEAEYPLHALTYARRWGSGGDGATRGGDGIVRELRVETDATVSIVSDRRRRGPPGRAGGADGTTGANAIDGEPVGSKVTREVPAGTVVRVATPGGGGYGTPDDEASPVAEDTRDD